MHDINVFTTVVRMLALQSPGLAKMPQIIAQIAYVTSQMALKVLWSDEAKIVLGSTMFYPLLTMTAIFLAAKVAPLKIVHTCACYCTRKMQAIWRKVQTILQNLAAHHATLTIKRNHLIASARVLVGTAEILMF